MEENKDDLLDAKTLELLEAGDKERNKFFKRTGIYILTNLALVGLFLAVTK